MADKPRVIRAIIRNKHYEIPEIWVVGYCQANKCDTWQAVDHWAYQSELAALESA